MVIVKGVIPVRDKLRESALALAQELASQTRAEKGCVSYEVYIKADTPRVIMLWQQWKTLDDLERHFASDHLDIFLDQIPPMIDGEVHSMRFDVIDEDGEPAVEPPAVTVADGTTLH